jgi:hypothetical protein
MATLRSVNTRFWEDPWVEDLDPSEKLLFLYLLTNKYANLAGIYEITVKRISFETGLNQETIRKGLERFAKDNKAYFVEDNYMFLPNWLKNQNLNSNMKKGVLTIFAQLPKSVLIRILGNHYQTVLKDYQTLLNTLLKYKIEVEVEEEYKNIFVPSRDSESDKFDTLNSTKPKLARTKGEALFDVPVQKKKKVSQDKYLALATKLSEIIQTKKNIKHTKSQIQSWSKEFARLEQENGIQYQRQKAAMRWYEEHIGDPYTPVIESGTSFRNKFIKLEAAIVRSENSYTTKTKNNSGLAHFDSEYNDILMRKATEKVTVL